MNKFLTNIQVSFIMYCVIVGYGVINLPKVAAENAGTGGWFSLIIATIIFIAVTYLVTYLNYLYEGKTIYEYGNLLIGSFFTKVFIVICIVYYFIFFTMTFRIYCEYLKLIILPKTPVVFLSLLLYITVFYLLTKGINTIARLCQIYGAIGILNLIFVTSILFTQGSFINIRPLFVTEDTLSYLKAVPKMTLPFVGMEVLFFLPFDRVKNKNIFKYTTFIIAFIGILYIAVVEASLSIAGENSIIHMKAAFFVIMKGVTVNYLEFLRRIDGFYMLFWSMNAVCSTGVWGYGVITFIGKLFKKAKYNLILIIVIVTSFIFSQLPSTAKQIELILLYNSYFGFFIFLVMPLILFLITKVKKYDKKV